MDSPILMAVGLLYSPVSAGLIALVGSFDPKEIHREVNVGKAMFGRCQVSVSVMLGSLTFHHLASIDSAVPLLALGAAAAVLVDHAANVGLVTVFASIEHGLPPAEILRRLRIGRPVEFLINYLGLGLLGVLLAHLYESVGFWSVPAVLIPLVFARQMFFRSRALEDAHKELKEREQVMRTLSNRMAEERQDERTQIAAYLHDDLAQMLFRLSLQVDLARRYLKAGDAAATEKELEAIRESKNRTSELVRALIRDLHRSPLGRAGLAEALASFTSDIGEGSGVRFHSEIGPMGLPPAIQLLIYHIAREAAMNALKHSGAANVWIALQPVDDGVELTVRDDGIGFDTEAPGPDGHFGLSMMRERAVVAGGVYGLESTAGEGTTITVRFPATYLEDSGQAPEEGPPSDQIVPVAEPAPSRAIVPA
jgi:signal transduction histidine kinase